MNPRIRIAPFLLLVTAACGPTIPTSAPPRGAGLGAREDHVADCKAAGEGLDLGGGDPSVMHAAYEAPTTPAERDKNVGVLDAAIERWSSARGGLDHAEVREAADWVVEQMKKRRAALIALQFKKVPETTPPTMDLDGKPLIYEVDKSAFVDGREPWFDAIQILNTWCQDMRPVG